MPIDHHSYKQSGYPKYFAPFLDTMCIILVEVKLMVWSYTLPHQSTKSQLCIWCSNDLDRSAWWCMFSYFFLLIQTYRHFKSLSSLAFHSPTPSVFGHGTNVTPLCLWSIDCESLRLCMMSIFKREIRLYKSTVRIISNGLLMPEIILTSFQLPLVYPSL